MTSRVIHTLAFIGAVAVLSSCNNHGAVAAEEQGMSKVEEKGRVVKTDEEWKKILTDEEFRISRKKGTERAFTGKYWDHKEEGVYTCVCCSQELFESDTKYKSGTGWPSFYAPTTTKNVTEERDSTLGMVRTEVLCSRCGAHLGHVFDDGPQPTGLRYCVNSASLRFVPEAERKQVETRTAMFGAGCFWGVEALFRKMDGVIETAVGYSGGTQKEPTYKEVCSDRTGHAEVVHITYDPSQASYDALLDLFWRSHDPTQLNRQGPDVGSQYRSVIFTYDEDQRKAAEASKAALEKSGKHGRKIVTIIEPAAEFWRAEEYHQRYYEKKGIDPTCHVPAGN